MKSTSPDRRVTEHPLRDLCEDRDLLVRVGDDVHPGRQDRQAEEHRAEERTHPHEGRDRVPPFGWLERGHAVRDRLDPGDGRATRGEGLQDQEDESEARQRLRRRERELLRGLGEVPVARRTKDVAKRIAHHQEEEVRGGREDPPRFPDAPEVAEREDHDEGQRDRHPPCVEPLEHGGQRRRPRCHGDRDGQDVVGEQRDAGDLRRLDPEVVAGDQIGAAGLRVCADRLPVREQEDAQHQEQRDRDRHDLREGRSSETGHDEDAEDLLGRVGGGRQVVAGEDGEGGGLPQPLVDEPIRREGCSHDPALQTGRAIRARGTRCRDLVNRPLALCLLHADSVGPLVSATAQDGGRAPQDVLKMHRCSPRGPPRGMRDSEG